MVATAAAAMLFYPRPTRTNAVDPHHGQEAEGGGWPASGQVCLAWVLVGEGLGELGSGAGTSEWRRRKR